MSWKATAYVKEISACPDGRKITRSEKLLLFVLADYHTTEKNRAWPAVRTLAQDALMSLRQAQRSLLALEKAGVIAIERPPGRGNMHLYFFPKLGELKGDMVAPFVLVKGDISGQEKVTFQEIKGDISVPLKKNQVLNQVRNQELSRVRRKEPADPREVFFAGTRLLIDTETHEAFQAAYEGIDLEGEYKRMDAWLVSNRRNYRNFGRFANTWLSRTGVGNIANGKASRAEEMEAGLERLKKALPNAGIQ